MLWIAWIRVQRNRGAPGVDGRTIEAIKQEGEVEFIRAIQRELVEKRYKPQHIRRVFIKKPNGKLRPLGISVVKDRVVQIAVKLVLKPIFEASFEAESSDFVRRAAVSTLALGAQMGDLRLRHRDRRRHQRLL